jgi:ABC-type nickel/cobalt efflux system permease component RcnA
MQDLHSLLSAEWTPVSLAAANAAALGMGAVHALSPGHGKTIVAAYLVGVRGKLRHAFLLGGIVTATHTASVFALGFAALFLTQYMLPQQLADVLSVVSGVSIVVFGLWLLRNRLRRLRHTHHHHAHHHHEHAATGSLLALGVAGGLTPCPSALVLMLTAVSLGRPALGLMLLVFFSAGLASVLIATGAAVLYARRLVPPEMPRLRWVPVASAGVITVAGVIVTAAALAR